MNVAGTHQIALRASCLCLPLPLATPADLLTLAVQFRLTDALKTLRPGDELFLDYGESYLEAWMAEGKGGP